MRQTIKEFSVAGTVNVVIKSDYPNKKISRFLDTIYGAFDNPLDDPKDTLQVTITDELPEYESKMKLGKDGVSTGNGFVMSNGHGFFRTEQELHVYIPQKVTRGKIPFKRKTPGRYLTDEIIEPLLQMMFLNHGMTFIHASTIVDSEGAVVLMGWRGTGKTNKVLENYGKKEIWSDDLAILDAEGNVYPYQRPIRLYSYNLNMIPAGTLDINKLKRKALITPPWQPVHYWILPQASSTATRLKELKYLNNSKTVTVAKDADYIMKFEQNFFDPIRLILLHTGVLEEKESVESVVLQAMNKS